MSYDLFSFIKHYEIPDLNEQLVECFANFEFDVELHPEFDLLNSSGFQPLIFLKSSKFFNGQVEFDILSGCNQVQFLYILFLEYITVFFEILNLRMFL